MGGAVNAMLGVVFGGSALAGSIGFGVITMLRLIAQFTMRYDLLTVDDRLTADFASTCAFINVGNCLGQSIGSAFGGVLVIAGVSYESLFIIYGICWLMGAALIATLPSLRCPQTNGAYKSFED